jgi:hypothetical protein
MRKWHLAAAAVAIFVAPVAAMAQAPIVIKFSHVVAPVHRRASQGTCGEIHQRQGEG